MISSRAPGTIEHERPSPDGLEAHFEHEGKGGDQMAKYEAYCVKCKAKREFEGEETTLKNGRRAAKGKCPVCGTTVMRILGK